MFAYKVPLQCNFSVYKSYKTHSAAQIFNIFRHSVTHNESSVKTMHTWLVWHTLKKCLFTYYTAWWQKKLKTYLRLVQGFIQRHSGLEVNLTQTIQMHVKHCQHNPLHVAHKTEYKPMYICELFNWSVKGWYLKRTEKFMQYASWRCATAVIMHCSQSKKAALHRYMVTTWM